MTGDILRVAIAGSVNEGKSSFLGRLLFEAGSLFDDQLGEVKRLTTDRKFHGSEYDFSLFTDGLEYEQNNNITVDVAYRYISLLNRKIVFADCPGHFEYTKNMITACSQAQVLLLVLDAQRIIENGSLAEQTLRHLNIAEDLAVSHIAIVVTKVDLFSNPRDAVEKVKNIFHQHVRGSGEYHFYPCSAYTGEGFNEIFDFLKNIKAKEESIDPGFLEIVDSTKKNILYCRGFRGRFFVGQQLTLTPEGGEFSIEKIYKNFAEVESVLATNNQPENFSIEYDFDKKDKDLKSVDLSSQVLKKNNIAVINSADWVATSSIKCKLMWFSEEKNMTGNAVLLKTGSTVVSVDKIVINGKFNIKLNRYIDSDHFEPNDKFLVDIHLAGQITFLKKTHQAQTSQFILIDGNSFETLAFGFLTF
jgi:bifunctional enzyme CysN/CysC